MVIPSETVSLPPKNLYVVLVMISYHSNEKRTKPGDIIKFEKKEKLAFIIRCLFLTSNFCSNFTQPHFLTDARSVWKAHTLLQLSDRRARKRDSWAAVPRLSRSPTLGNLSSRSLKSFQSKWKCQFPPTKCMAHGLWYDFPPSHWIKVIPNKGTELWKHFSVECYI